MTSITGQTTLDLLAAMRSNKGSSQPKIIKIVNSKTNKQAPDKESNLIYFFVIVTSCFLPCANKPFQDGIYSQRKEFAPQGANSFL